MGALFLPRHYLVTSIIVLTSILILPEITQCHVISYYSRFLIVPPDARGKSLAGGGSVFSKGAVSAYYNPALLVTSGEFSAEANYCDYLPLIYDDLSINSIFFSRKFKDYGYFGIGYSRIDYQTPLWDYYDWGEWVDICNYSLSLWTSISLDPHNSLGAGIKYIESNAAGFGSYSRLRDEEASTVAIDIGFLSRGHFPGATWQNDEVFYPDLSRLFKVERDKGFTFGISFSNLGRDFRYDDYPFSEPLLKRLRVAAGYQAIDSEPVGLRLTVDATKLLIDVDDTFKEEWSEVAWSYGLEATFYYILDFRAGRLLDRGDHQRYTTIGFGLGPEWLGIDYSYVLESDEHWNRAGKEYSISINCNISPRTFTRD